MFEATAHSYLTPFDGSFRVAKSPTTAPADVPGRKALRDALRDKTEELHDLQRILYAHDHHAILLVFQAMDAAG